MIKEIFTKAVAHMQSIMNGVVKSLRVDSERTCAKIAQVDRNQDQRHLRSLNADKVNTGAIENQIQGVERAIKDTPQIDLSEVKNGLQDIVSTLKEEIKTLDKDIVVNNDFSKVEAQLEKINKSVNNLTFPQIKDTTKVLKEILIAINTKNLKQVETLLQYILDKPFPDYMEVGISPKLVDDSRVKVALSKEQAQAIGGSITLPTNKTVEDKLDIVNANLDAIEENQTDKSQMVQITNGTDEAEIVSCDDDTTDLEDVNGVVVQSVLHGRISGTEIRPLRIDGATNTLQTIEYEHHEIHAGSHYFICDSVSLANAANIDLTIQTPATTEWSHIVFNGEGTGQIQLEIFEGSDYDADGTVVTPPNSDRNSNNTSSLVLRTDPTVNSDGTQIFKAVVGAHKIAGIVGRSNEIILKQATKYIFRITNGTAVANIVSWCGEWYEHTNKN